MFPMRATSVPRTVHRVYTAAAHVLRSNPAVYRVLFGHWPARHVKGQLWDWTTLALASALRRHARPGGSVLDMGTGPTGVLAVYAKQRLRCGRVCGVDHLVDILPTATATASRCGADVEFVPSTLFNSVEGRFDLIVFNAPYIPVGEGRSLGALRDATDESRWSGGTTGLETIVRFLRVAPEYLTPSGYIVLGVNHFYLPPETVRPAFAEVGLTELGTVLHRITQGCAYILRPQPTYKARRRNTPPESNAARASSGA